MTEINFQFHGREEKVVAPWDECKKKGGGISITYWNHSR